MGDVGGRVGVGRRRRKVVADGGGGLIMCPHVLPLVLFIMSYKHHLFEVGFICARTGISHKVHICRRASYVSDTHSNFNITFLEERQGRRLIIVDGSFCQREAQVHDCRV